MTAAPFATGATALTVLVPEAETVVGHHRSRFDPAARHGMPAHVTVLYPWLPRDVLTADGFAALERLAAGLRSFDARLDALGRHHQSLWLRATPADAFRALTDAVWSRWPAAPPYAGQFDDAVPHLTVADGQPEAVVELVADDLAPALPISFRVRAVALHVFQESRWARERVFPLG